MLEDLYQTDPSLRSEEARLIPLIEQMLCLRPDIEPTARFKADLRRDVLASHKKLYGRSPSFLSRMTSSFSLKQFMIPVGAMALGALLVTTLPGFRSSLTQHSPLFTTDSNGRFTSLTNNAFGSLKAGEQVRRGAEQTGGGGNAAPSMMAGPVQSDVVQDSKMIMPPGEITNYKYVYRGELPTWEANLNVYKRRKDAAQNSTLIQSLKQTTQGLVNLDALQGLELQSFTVSQKQPYGYVVTVDLWESAISFQQNYTEWPNPAASCRDEACFQRLRLKMSDMPADADIINIAQSFLQTHQISTEGYGPAQINNEWRRSYELALNKDEAYVPETVSVVYPIVIDGKTTYDESGFPAGMMVNVHVREKRVESTWNITTNRFEQSAYAAETDQARIRSVMEKGGVYPGFVSPEAKNTIEIELDTPEMILEKIFMPREPSQPVDELLVPALRFAVKTKPENGYSPSYVIVPLIKDVLDQRRDDVVHIMR